MKINPNLGEVNLEFLGCGLWWLLGFLVRKTYGSRKQTNAMLDAFAMLLLYSSHPRLSLKEDRHDHGRPRRSAPPSLLPHGRGTSQESGPTLNRQEHELVFTPNGSIHPRAGVQTGR